MKTEPCKTCGESKHWPCKLTLARATGLCVKSAHISETTLTMRRKI